MPQSLWAHFYKGRCTLQMGVHDNAAASFAVIVAFSPRSAGAVYYRGLAALE